MNFCKRNLLIEVDIEKEIFFNIGSWYKDNLSLVLRKLTGYFKN